MLPNIDDGSKSWEESLQMVSIAIDDGIKGTVCTPHWIQGSDWEPAAASIRQKVQELNLRIEDAGIEFTVYPGMEIAIAPHLDDLLASGCILPLSEGEYVLLEIPFYSLPHGLEEIIERLDRIGKKTILAHPERGKEFQENPSRILDFKELGASVQITASSLCGDFGEKAETCSLSFAHMGVIDVVASDAHSSRRRPPTVSSGLKILEDEIGIDKVDKIIENSYIFAGLTYGA
jgi:protein-tyrosine phosphatase